jgi:hypothetical protein
MAQAELPEPLKSVLLKMTNARRDDRYSCAKDVLKSLG